MILSNIEAAEKFPDLKGLNIKVTLVGEFPEELIDFIQKLIDSHLYDSYITQFNEEEFNGTNPLILKLRLHKSINASDICIVSSTANVFSTGYFLGRYENSDTTLLIYAPYLEQYPLRITRLLYTLPYGIFTNEETFTMFWSDLINFGADTRSIGLRIKNAAILSRKRLLGD